MTTLPFHHPSSPLSRTSQNLPQTHSIHPALLKEAQQKKMSIARSYYLARRARSKLSAEAARHDHDLRLLVGHANLLDSLMIHLAEAERDQEEWFNQAIQGNMIAEEEEEYEEDSRDWPQSQPETQGWLATDYESDTESEEEEDEEEEDSEDEMEFTEYELSTSSKGSPSGPRYQTIIGVSEVDEDYDDEEDEEDEDGLYTLTRTVSHRPPQLVADMSDDEEEESNPPSPPQVTLSSFSSKKGSSSKPTYFHQHPHHPPSLPITSNHPEPFYGNDYYRSTPMIDSY